MWRPEGWENPYKDEHFITYKDSNANVYFERGADAMLEALIKQGRFNYAGYGTTDFPDARWGWFVFIPEG